LAFSAATFRPDDGDGLGDADLAVEAGGGAAVPPVVPVEQLAAPVRNATAATNAVMRRAFRATACALPPRRGVRISV
jgi:hypothetical protein